MNEITVIAFWKQRSEAGSEQPSAGSTLGTAAEVCMDCQGDIEDALDASASVITEALHGGGEIRAQFGKRPSLRRAGNPGRGTTYKNSSLRADGLSWNEVNDNCVIVRQRLWAGRRWNWRSGSWLRLPTLKSNDLTSPVSFLRAFFIKAQTMNSVALCLPGEHPHPPSLSRNIFCRAPGAIT